MLIEFSVANHRAFREKQTFSMVASAATERASHGHVCPTGFSVAPFVLTEACLFGANGAGKSSMIEAMSFMVEFIRNSFRNAAGSGIPVEPFIYHSEWINSPSEFEIIFIHSDTLYQYGFVLSKERVVEEWLFARPKTTGRERSMFTRKYDFSSEKYQWEISATHLKGERDSWKSQTRSDALFLTTAVQLNAEGLKEAFEWLTNSIQFIDKSPLKKHNTTAQMIQKTDGKNRVLDFMREADFSLTNIVVQEVEISLLSSLDGAPQQLVDALKALEQLSLEADPDARKQLRVNTVRLNEKGDQISLPMNEESTGTRAFFNFAAPIFLALDRGVLLVVDELNQGLHPLAFQKLISVFADPTVNCNGAQLIFTTHDTTVTSRECIGRDQIWLVEKGSDLAARLKPFSDYKTRDSSTFQKGYLQGRFGAIPKIFN